jgi:hypothetical protein
MNVQRFSVAALMIVSFGVLYGAYLQLSASIYAQGVTKSTRLMQTVSNAEIESHYKLASNMMLKLQNNSFASADHYIQLHQLGLWLQFRATEMSTPNLHYPTGALLQQSRTLRPTWPLTYIMEAKQAATPQQKQRFLALAQRFGPVEPQVELYEIQLGFEQWEQLNRAQKALLARKLMQNVSIYKQKVALNDQLPYTPAQEKICNLLKFNHINLSNCRG